jgi:glycine dehydrogenase
MTSIVGTSLPFLQAYSTYVDRHLGSSTVDIAVMLSALGFQSLEELTNAAIPRSIARDKPLELPDGIGEPEALAELKLIMAQNRPVRTFLGLGYAPSHMPAVIQRNVLENPGFYTQYTPYQAEIAQGRLEALLNFQTMISSLTALPLANASLLDEATAAAEAMVMCRGASNTPGCPILVDEGCHPQTIAVVRTRARALGINVLVENITESGIEKHKPVCILLQLPKTDGTISDYRRVIACAHDASARAIVAADLLSLTLLVPPGELGADIAIGPTQRLGLPLGYGGPHAAYLAAAENLKRLIPGRIVGVSRDQAGKPSYRLALQTREQHIRRERASSNICTAQVLPAILASFYAIYHGPKGLTAVAERIVRATQWLAEGLVRLGYTVNARAAFDTLRIPVSPVEKVRILAAARSAQIELRDDILGCLCLTLAETTRAEDLMDLLRIFSPTGEVPFDATELEPAAQIAILPNMRRQSRFLSEPIFNTYHTEHELLRYLRRLESRDLSLTTSMIPLGSCTMKLNATTAMLPLSWPEVAAAHPFTSNDNVPGYARVISDLEKWLAEITGLQSVSLQPNAGAQGEYTGLLVIGAWHASRGEAHRRVCLIPASAHGTNPASATLAGLRVVPVACDSLGNVDLSDLTAKAKAHSSELSCLMVTYPSTHGVFEEKIEAICEIVHRFGGQVYLDGANMNAQVGLCRPGDYGADVCHINLHKTFAIPHGGGGPGMGPIAVANHLAPFLPSDVFAKSGDSSIGPVSASAYGSASVLTVSWMYMRLMGAGGLRRASQLAILNANYMAKRLEPHYPIVFKGQSGLCAHEFIIDARGFKKSAGIEVDDIAKRLMDYGFHAPTMSFPVPGTLMIEPTESESLYELNRFCDALIAIREELRNIESGRWPRDDNPLKNAPHTAHEVTKADWTHPYSRSEAAFPSPHTREHKFWPAVARIDNAAGDRNLICTCLPIEEYASRAGS